MGPVEVTDGGFPKLPFWRALRKRSRAGEAVATALSGCRLTGGKPTR